jgi:hypothetical protein
MTTSIVDTKTFDSAAKFVDALSPRLEPWYMHPDRWVFRGQRDASWRLIPSAARNEAWQSFDRVVGDIGPAEYTNDARLQLELAAIWRFSREADRQGLLVPGFDHTWVDLADLKAKFNYLKDVFASREFFPRPEWRPLFGMAQHYSIPTRLLDWSERPLVAAYFAASGTDSTARGKHIAVWALDHNRLESIARLDERIIIVRPPWATNPNLRAQRGLFTLHGVRLRADAKAVDVPLDEATQGLAGASPAAQTGDKPIMYQFRLPVEKHRS